MPDHTQAEHEILMAHDAIACDACGAKPVKRTDEGAGITLLLCPACCGEAEDWLDERRTEATLRRRIEELEHDLMIRKLRRPEQP